MTFYYFVGFVGQDSKVRVPYTYPGFQGPAIQGGFNLKGHGGKTVWNTYQSPYNGVMVAGFLTMAFSSILLLNRLFQRRVGFGILGPMDRLLAALSRSRVRLGQFIPFLLPAALMVFAFNCIVSYIATPIHFHLDAREAVRQFSAASIRGWDLSQTGPFVFGEGIGGQVRVALLTPSLVRELNRNGMRIGGKVGPREYPIPGALPLAGMAGLSLWVLLGRHPRTRHAILAFIILNGYVVAWLVSAQSGVMGINGDVDFQWVFHFVPFAFAAIVVTTVILRKVQDNGLPLDARQGWTSLFLLAGAAMPLASYLLANATKGSPAGLWVFVYTALSALFVLLARLERFSAD
jgi:hypothetical protein